MDILKKMYRLCVCVFTLLNMIWIVKCHLFLGSVNNKGRSIFILGFAISVKTTVSCFMFHFKAILVNKVIYLDLKFTSYLRQVSRFLRVLRFPPPIKLIATI